MLKICLDKGVSIDKISFSSDGQGSLPRFNEKKEFVGLGVGKVTSLFNQVRDAVIANGTAMILNKEIMVRGTFE